MMTRAAFAHGALAGEFGEVAEGLLTRLADDGRVQAELAQEGFSDTAWDAFTEAGWFEALLPEADGGLGLGLRELAPIMRAVGHHLCAGPVVEHAVALPLVVAATPVGEARKRLEASLRGQRRMALVDPEAAGGTLSISDGRLEGTVEIVRGGPVADDLLVVADECGRAVFAIVGVDKPGVEIDEHESLDPRLRVARVRFTGVALEPTERAAAGDAATDERLHERVRASLQLMVGCELAGIARHALALAVDYAKQREQFGRPIGSFQAVQHLLAEAARQEFGLSLLCADAARVVDDQPAELPIAGRVIKAHAATVARSVTETSLQVHGGVGFTIEHELHLHYKRLLGLQGYFGDPDALHEQLGRQLLGTGDDPWPAW